MQKIAKKRLPLGKVIAMALVVLVAAALVNPGLLFFLTPAQQQAVSAFQSTYFSANNPI